MSTRNLFEYRCSRCLHSNLAELGQQASLATCPHCQCENVIPEPTEERIARGLEMLRTNAGQLEQMDLSDQAVPSRSEVIEMIDAQEQRPVAEMRFDGFPSADPVYRLLAYLIDTTFFLVALAVSALAVLGAATVGFIHPLIDPYTRELSLGWQPTLILYFFPAIFMIYQWNLVTLTGQTLGKKIMGLRVVQNNGQVVGFLNGVAMREWLRIGLSFIPFFALVDVLFIFGGSRRCIHDFLAGTRVVCDRC